MSSLFINESGVTVGYSGNYIEVRYKDGLIRKLPVESVEEIYLLDYVQVTSQCMVQFLQHGIKVVYCSKNGGYFGRLQSTGHVNVFRQRKQAALANTEFSLKLAKNIIYSKIHNQKVLLKRYSRNNENDIGDILMAMQISANKIQNCKSVNELMGYEGNAARKYFEGLSRLVTDEFKFKGRSKRPPKDEFNAMLSFGYYLLLNEVHCKIESKGLNPYFGFIHSDRENHPTLASDMMEEWRAVLVDSVVMSLVNGNEIHKESFRCNPDEPGIYMTKDGLNIFIKKYNKKMNTTSSYLDYIDYTTSFRHAIELQIGRLAKAIEEEDAEVYHPIYLR